MTSNNRDFLVGVVVGSLIGAAAAILYAPQPGTETREQLKERARQAKEKTSELAEQTRVKAGGLMQQAQEKASVVSERTRARVGGVAQQGQSILDKGKELVERQREAARAAVEAGRQAFQEKQAELHHEVEADTLPASTSTGTTT